MVAQQHRQISLPNGPLIGFQRCPGCHTREHLAEVFLHVLERIKITSKSRTDPNRVTLDNASNNNTFMIMLAAELRALHIPFNAVKCRIHCFPHIVNIACKAVLASIMEHSNGSLTQDVFSDSNHVATICALVNAIQSLSLWHQYFNEIVKTMHQKELQLLPDVDINWSSTLLMIECALELEVAITKFLTTAEFDDLCKYELSDSEWDDLALVSEILLVPHVFQQHLSSEKTPTLCDTIPSFEAMVQKWVEKQEEDPETHAIVQQGLLDKLNTYREQVNLVPA
ncbi:hypothetical protein K443DRAFT_111958 [Laccaria amethystina LaAM-08-1]|uniref:Uncharacterized protein n=1 Tax=Laccaria amethystina LaAM-08-1 TaxID=1095629 RepID=A0A0C9WXE8_9AGAR|nr:hypothetical protein K443DRAFT_111958 [Laccaria amethystina LaAM-08-1]